MSDPEALLDKLIAADVDFVVIGGFAVIAHGGTLRTQDLDVCCPFEADNITRLLSALEGTHPVHRMMPERRPLSEPPDSYATWRNLYLDTDVGQLDCLSEVAGVGGYPDVLAESIEVELPAGPCRVLGLDALIRAKEAMAGEKDRQAVILLKAIRERLQADAGS